MRKDWSVFVFFPIYRFILSCVVPFHMVLNVRFFWSMDVESMFCDMCNEFFSFRDVCCQVALQ